MPLHEQTGFDLLALEVCLITTTTHYIGQGEFNVKTPSGSHRSLPAQPLSLAACVALVISNGAWAQTATDDEFTGIVRAVPQLLGNVLDNDNGATNSIVTDSPNRGEIDLQADGDAIYTPTSSVLCSQLSDEFTYINSTVQNALVNIQLLRTGVADSYTVPAGQTLTEDVQTNDRLPINALGDPVDHLDINQFQFADNGSVEQIAPDVTNQTGQFIFTPDTGFSGLARFEYQTDDEDLGCLSNTLAEIIVTPVANDDEASVPGAVETCGIDVTANDIGSDLELVDLDQPSSGSARIDGDGTLCYQPTAAFAGPISFGYTLQDGFGSETEGVVNITVENQAPSAVDDAFETLANTPVNGNMITNDNDPNGDTLNVIANTQPASGAVTVADSGAFTYTPDIGISGTDTFDYTAADGQGGESTATVTLTILPVAPDQIFNGAPGQVLSGNLLSNAVGSGLSVVSNSEPANGNLTVEPNGDFTFERPLGELDAENFDYTISDSAGNQATGSVTLGIAVEPVSVPGLVGAPLGLLAVLLGWLGWRRLK